MRVSVNKRSLMTSAALFFMVALTITGSATNVESRAIIDPGRVMSGLVAAGLLAAALAFTARIRLSTGIALLSYVCFIAYGSVLAAALGNGTEASTSLSISVAIVATGIAILSESKGGIFTGRLLGGFLLYTAAILLMTIAIGGIRPEFPQPFQLGSLSVDDGMTRYYSQGLSQFYGLAAIICAGLATRLKRPHHSFALAIVCLGMLALSFVGGARGESLAALLVVSALLISGGRRGLIMLMFAIGAATTILLAVVDLENFIIFRRLAALSENLGGRDALTADALALLGDNPVCLWIGCGFNYFQAYYEYRLGLYPHNLVLELIIVIGLPFTLLLFLSSGFGLASFIKSKSDGRWAMLAILSYYTLLGLKSGTLMQSWFFMAALFYFAGEGVASVKSSSRRFINHRPALHET